MGGTGLAPTPAWGVIGGEGARAQRSCLGWGFQSKLRINFYKTLKMQAQFALTNATISKIWGGLQEGGRGGDREGAPRGPRPCNEGGGRARKATLFNDNSLSSVSCYSKGKGGGTRSGQCILGLMEVLVHNPTGTGGFGVPCSPGGLSSAVHPSSSLARGSPGGH